MALAAAEALGLDLTASWVVGDSAVDVGLARAVGAHAAARRGRSTFPDTDVQSFPDLAAAVRAHPRDQARGRPGAAAAAFPARQLRATAAAFGARLRRASWRGPSATVDMAADRPRRRAPQRRARPGRHGLRVRQRRLGLDRQPPPVRPRQGRARRHRPARPGAQPEHQRRALQRHRQRHRLRRGVRVPAASRWPGPATCWSRSRRRVGRRTSCAPWSGRAGTACRPSP